MRFYTVYAPPAGTAAAPAPTSLVFVKEGFCWPALFVPLLWLIFRRLWLVLLAYVVVAALFALAGRWADGPVFGAVSLFFAVWFALEANELRRWTLERRGWRVLGVAGGRRLADAELGWFSHRGRDPEAPKAERPTAAVPPLPASPENEVIGLFPEPGPQA